jgi:ribose transport system substrate-binding protein
MPRTFLLLLAAMMATAAALGGCSSGGSSSATSSSGAESTSTAGSASNPQLAAAEANVTKLLANPSSIGSVAPLAKRPPTGKLLVYLTTPQPTTTLQSNGAAAAAKALGWQYKRIPIGSQPTAIQAAFQSALALNPTVIAEGGSPKSAFAAQLATAKARGIGVVEFAGPDTPGTGDGIIADISGVAAAQTSGRDLADEVAATSGGKANVAIFSVASYPVLADSVTAFVSELKQACPACTTMQVNQQVSDVGTQTPTSVVNTFRRNPQLNYALFTFGDETFGVDEALKSAGLADKIKVVGDFASAANQQAIANGSEFAWTVSSQIIFGWQIADAAARFVNGQPTAVAGELQPIQLITSANVSKIVSDSQSNYIGVANYPAQFEKLWLVSS